MRQRKGDYNVSIPYLGQKLNNIGSVGKVLALSLIPRSHIQRPDIGQIFAFPQLQR